MKPIIETRTNVSSSLDSVQFSIDQQDLPQIFELLRTGLYRDKILAVLREYGANAWDANRMAGKGTTPIVVHVPDEDDPVLRIRDQGPGLTPEQIKSVYSKYGASTKRDTNVAVGSFGVGAKSGFAYADTFTITSWTPGSADDAYRIKRTYVASLDESGLGKIELLDESPSDESTGVEISLTAKYHDLYTFNQRAVALFQHFEPRPEINVDLPVTSEKTVLRAGTITKSGYESRWTAIMGCVPYRLDLDQLDQAKIHKCLRALSGSVNLEIGDVQVTASREELRYTDRTKAKIIQRLEELLDEYVIHALKELADPSMTSWDKRIKCQVLRDMGLPLPEEYEDLAKSWVKVEYDPLVCGFTILHNGHPTTQITVASNTRFIVDDTGKPLANYVYLRQHDYVVRGCQGDRQTPDDVRAKLENVLKVSGLDGAAISLLSAEHYAAPPQKAKKFTNPKHKAKMFRLVGTGGKPYSDNWETCERAPEDSDVYVVIEQFEVGGDGSWYRQRRLDVEMAKSLGETMPEVYGYKTSERKPVDESKIKGTKYSTWREAWLAGLVAKHADKIQEQFWVDAFGDANVHVSAKQVSKLQVALGKDHEICAFLRRHVNAKRDSAILRLVGETMDYDASDAGMAFAALQAKYPLLRGNAFSHLWNSGYSYDRHDPKPWQDYVRMVDELAARREAEERAWHGAGPDLTMVA